MTGSQVKYEEKKIWMHG